MAKIEFKGLEEYIAQLNKVEANTDKIIGKALYRGADKVANSIKSAIDALPVDNRNHVDGIRNGITSIQKEGLKHSFGIAKARHEGTETNVKLGFDGYNKVVTKKWTQGQPNAMIARSVESGTSFMRKNPFVSKATNSAKGSAEAIMAETIDTEIEKLIK